jgi:gliding motility-associated-like protein
MKKALLTFVLFAILYNKGFSQGSNCATADPFCTGTTYTFPNNTGIPNQGTYQCLGTTPNPAWYYLQIANSGNIDIHIVQTNTSGSGIDVDFIMWGPFTSVANACATITPATAAVDCSYSTAAQEDANIVGAVTGQFYMLMLTNYSNQAGTISFSQTGGSGSTNCAIVCAAPNATTGATQNLTCASPTAVLSASSTTPGAMTYSWAGPGIVSGGSTQTPTVNAPGTYTVTVTNPAAPTCPTTATQLVTFNNTPPNIVMGGPQSITCTVTSLNLSANSTTPGATYSWAGPGIVSGGTTGTPTVNVDGTYTVTITDPANGCTSTGTQVVNLNNTPPTITTGATQTITCLTPTTTLSATATGVTYNWSGAGITAGGTTANPTVNAAGTYTVTVTDATSGCTSTATQDVISTISTPDATAGSSQTVTCAVTSVALSGNSTTSGVSYSWSGPGGFTSSLQNPNATAAGTYTVTVTDANGCTNTATQVVTANTTAPNIVTGAAQTLTCATTSVSLSANSSTTGATYSWAGPGITSGGSTATPTAGTSGTYTVTVTDPANGCTATATQLVNSNTTPPIANAGADNTFPCNVSSMNLSGAGSSSGAGFTYSWTGAGISAGSNTLSPTITGAGTYTITVTNTANGCTTSDVVVINPDVLPDANFTASPNSGTPPLTVSFTNNSTGSVGYLWNLGDGTSSTATNPSNIYVGTGSYPVTLYAVNGNGCVDSMTIMIEVSGNSVLVIPNVFTPNGDNVNDLFTPTVAEWIKTFEAEVYDRWGLKMFEWTNEHSGWNGQSKNGSPAPDGAYYYIIKAKGTDNKDYQFTGYVQLITTK